MLIGVYLVERLMLISMAAPASCLLLVDTSVYETPGGNRCAVARIAVTLRTYEQAARCCCCAVDSRHAQETTVEQFSRDCGRHEVGQRDGWSLPSQPEVL